MFTLNENILWNITFFFLYAYNLLLVTSFLYLLPLIFSSIKINQQSLTNNFFFIFGEDVLNLILTVLFLFFFINFTWSSSNLTLWFGHIAYTNFQQNFFFIIILIFKFCLLAYVHIFYFGNSEINDYIITIFNFFWWILFLFLANSLFAVIFLLEILSTLIFLLVVTSTFSSIFFYNNFNINLNNYFIDILVVSFFTGLFFFFWISLISSLMLFLFIVFFYSYFLTCDWNLVELTFSFLYSLSSFTKLFTLLFIWIFIFFCIFLKCGLIPFYFWKPLFFKSLPMHALLFYILFYYFFIFLYFTFLLLIYLNEIFYFFIFLFNLFLIMGIILILSLLCESFYLKVFLAMSSILNTLFVFLAFVGLTPNFLFLL